MTDNKLISFGIMIAILLVLITGCSSGEASILKMEAGPYDQIAQCLTEKGAVIYKTEWCPHCKNQKELFGTSIQYLTMVDCDDDRATCQDAGVKGYPTWKINGALYPGVSQPETLAALAGCEAE
jgi:glutaredoxin